MKYSKDRKTKALALFLAALFSFQTIAWSAPGLSLAPITPNTFSKNLRTEWQIPNSLGHIEKVYAPKDVKSKQPLLIHIRDSHANPEAQKNIELLISHFVHTKKVKTVALEGAFRRLPVEKFRFFKEAKINHEAGEALMKRGLLTGAEVYGLGRDDQKVQFYGVDDLNLYRESLKIFRTVKQDISARKALDSYEGQLKTLELKTFNPELLEWVRARHQYESDSSKFADYLTYLHKTTKAVLQKDLAHPEYQFDYPSLSRFYKIQEKESKISPEKITKDLDQIKSRFTKSQTLNTQSLILQGLNHIQVNTNPEIFTRWAAEQGISGRVFFEKLYEAALKQKTNLYAFPDFLTFAGLLILREELDAETLEKDMKRIENELELKLAKTEQEKELLQTEKDFSLIKKLLHLEMTRSEYEQYKKQKGDRSHLKSRPVPFLSEKLIQSAETFYELSQKRDHVFIKKALALESKNSTVLVAGGFHTDGIEEILKRKDIAHIVVTPRITEIKNDGLYEKLMLNTRDRSRNVKADLSLSSVAQNLTPALVTQTPADIEAINLDTAEGQREAIISFIQEGISRLQGKASLDEINALIREAVRQNPEIFEGVLFKFNDKTGELSASIPTTVSAKPRQISSSAVAKARSEVRYGSDGFEQSLLEREKSRLWYTRLQRFLEERKKHPKPGAWDLATEVRARLYSFLDARAHRENHQPAPDAIYGPQKISTQSGFVAIPGRTNLFKIELVGFDGERIKIKILYPDNRELKLTAMPNGWIDHEAIPFLIRLDRKEESNSVHVFSRIRSEVRELAETSVFYSERAAGLPQHSGTPLFSYKAHQEIKFSDDSVSVRIMDIQGGKVQFLISSHNAGFKVVESLTSERISGEPNFSPKNLSPVAKDQGITIQYGENNQIQIRVVEISEDGKEVFFQITTPEGVTVVRSEVRDSSVQSESVLLQVIKIQTLPAFLALAMVIISANLSDNQLGENHYRTFLQKGFASLSPHSQALPHLTNRSEVREWEQVREKLLEAKQAFERANKQIKGEAFHPTRGIVSTWLSTPTGPGFIRSDLLEREKPLAGSFFAIEDAMAKQKPATEVLALFRVLHEEVSSDEFQHRINLVSRKQVWNPDQNKWDPNPQAQDLRVAQTAINEALAAAEQWVANAARSEVRLQAGRFDNDLKLIVPEDQPGIGWRGGVFSFEDGWEIPRGIYYLGLSFSPRGELVVSQKTSWESQWPESVMKRAGDLIVFGNRTYIIQSINLNSRKVSLQLRSEVRSKVKLATPEQAQKKIPQIAQKIVEVITNASETAEIEVPQLLTDKSWSAAHPDGGGFLVKPHLVKALNPKTMTEILNRHWRNGYYAHQVVVYTGTDIKNRGTMKQHYGRIAEAWGDKGALLPAEKQAIQKLYRLEELDFNGRVFTGRELAETLKFSSQAIKRHWQNGIRSGANQKIGEGVYAQEWILEGEGIPYEHNRKKIIVINGFLGSLLDKFENPEAKTVFIWLRAIPGKGPETWEKMRKDLGPTDPAQGSGLRHDLFESSQTGNNVNGIQVPQGTSVNFENNGFHMDDPDAPSRSKGVRLWRASRSELRQNSSRSEVRTNIFESLANTFKNPENEIQKTFGRLKPEQKNNIETFFQNSKAVLRDEAQLFSSKRFTVKEKLLLLNLLILRAHHARAAIIDIPPHVMPGNIAEEMKTMEAYLQKEDRGSIAETTALDEKNTAPISQFLNKTAVFSGYGIDEQLLSITNALSDTLTHEHGVAQEELQEGMIEAGRVLKALNRGIKNNLRHLALPAQSQEFLTAIHKMAAAMLNYQKIFYVTSADNPAQSIVESLLGEAYKDRIVFINNADPEYLRQVTAGISSQEKTALVLAASKPASDPALKYAYDYLKETMGLQKQDLFFVLPEPVLPLEGENELFPSISMGALFPESETALPENKILQPAVEERWSLYTPAGLLALELAGISLPEFVEGGAAYIQDQASINWSMGDGDSDEWDENFEGVQNHILQNAAFLLPVLIKVLYGKKISKREISLVTHAESLLPFFHHAAAFWLNPALQGTAISIIGTTSPRKNHYDLQIEQKGENRGFAWDITPAKRTHPIIIGAQANVLFANLLFSKLVNAIRRGRNRALEAGKRPTATQYIPQVTTRTVGYLAAQYQMMAAVLAGIFKSHKGNRYENFPKPESLAGKRFEELLVARLSSGRSEMRVSQIGDMNIGGARFNVDASFSQKGIQEKFLNLIPALLSVIKTVRKELKKEGAHDFLNSAKDSLEKLPYYKTRADQIMGANTAADLEEAETLIVAGIGGSSVGAKAILEAMKAQAASSPSKKMPRVIFLEGLDPDVIHRQMQGVSLRKSRILYISKSGETNEPNANFNSLKDPESLKGMGVIDSLTPEEFAKRVTVVTDLGTGRLYQEALAQGYNIFPHPLKIGGRFTLFSSVGVLTLVMAGVDVEPLLRGAISQADSMLKLNDEEIGKVEKPLSEAINQRKSLAQHLKELDPIVRKITQEGIQEALRFYQERLREINQKLKELPRSAFNEREALSKEKRMLLAHLGSNIESITLDNQEALASLKARLEQAQAFSRDQLQAVEVKLPGLQAQAAELLKRAPGVLMAATRFLLNEGDISKKKQKSAEERTQTRHITLILSGWLNNFVEWIRQLRNESLGKAGMDIFSIAYQGMGAILMNLSRFLEKGQIFTLVRQKAKSRNAAEEKLATFQEAQAGALRDLFTSPEYNVPIAAEVELEEGLESLGSYMMAEMIATMVEAKIQPSGKVDYSVEPGVKEQKRQSSRERQAAQRAEAARQAGEEPEEKIIDIRGAAAHVETDVENVLQNFIETAAPLLEDEIAFGNYGDPLLRYNNAHKIIFESLKKNPNIHSIWFRNEQKPVVLNPQGTLMLAVTPLENSEAIEKRDVSVGPIFGVYRVQRDSAGSVITGPQVYNRQNLESSMILLHGPTGGVKSFFGSIREDIGGRKVSTVYDFAKDPKGHWHPVESPKRSDILPIIEIGYSGRTSGIFGRQRDWPPSLRTFYDKWIKLAPKNRYSNSVADPYEILLNNGFMAEAMTPLEAQLVGAIFEDSSGNGRSLVMTAKGSQRATEVSLADYANPFTTSAQIPAYFGSQENLELLEREFIVPGTQAARETLWNLVGGAADALMAQSESANPSMVTSLYMFLQKSLPHHPETIRSYLDRLGTLLPDQAQLVSIVKSVIRENLGATSEQLLQKLDEKCGGPGSFVSRFRYLGSEDSYRAIDADETFRALGNPILENKILSALREAYNQTSVGELILNLDTVDAPPSVKQTAAPLKNFYAENSPTMNNVGWRTPQAAKKPEGVSLRKPGKSSVTLDAKIKSDYQTYKAKQQPADYPQMDREYEQLAAIVRSFSSIIAQNTHLFLDPEAGEYLSVANETDDETAAMDEVLHALLMGVNDKLGVKYEDGIYPLMQLCNRLISEENAEKKGNPPVRDGAIWHEDLVKMGFFAEKDMPDAFKVGGKRDLLYDIEIDPLDGSSKMATKGTVGALISVYKTGTRELVAAIYVTFGPQIQLTIVTDYQEGPVAYQFALTKEGRTKGSAPEFVLVDKSRTLPPAGLPKGIGMALGGNRTKWDPKIFRAMAGHVETTMNGYASYSGSYAADATSLTVSDILDYQEIGGGAYIYVAEEGGTKVGRLRPHETRPVGKIFQMMGGYASTGYVNILDVDPEAPQDIDSIIVGSYDVVKEFEDLALRDAYQKIMAKGRDQMLALKGNPEALYQKARELAEQSVWKGANLRLHPEEYDAIAKRAVLLFLGEQKQKENLGKDANYIAYVIDQNRTTRNGAGDFIIDVPLRIKNAYQARLWNRENAKLSDEVWTDIQTAVKQGAVEPSFEFDARGNIVRVKLFDRMTPEGATPEVQAIYQRWIAESHTRSEVRTFTPGTIEIVHADRLQNLDIKKIVFDWEGVIQDSAAVIDQYEAVFLTRLIHGDSYRAEQMEAVKSFVDQNHHMTIRELVNWALEKKEGVQPTTFFDQLKSQYIEGLRKVFEAKQEAWREEMPLVPGIEILLNALLSQYAHAERFVATNLMEEVKKVQIKSMVGFNSPFSEEGIFGTESNRNIWSAEKLFSKAGVIQHLMADGTQTHQIVFIEDNPENLKRVSAATGVITIAVARDAKKLEGHRKTGKADIILHGDFTKAEELLAILFPRSEARMDAAEANRRLKRALEVEYEAAADDVDGNWTRDGKVSDHVIQTIQGRLRENSKVIQAIVTGRTLRGNLNPERTFPDVMSVAEQIFQGIPSGSTSRLPLFPEQASFVTWRNPNGEWTEVDLVQRYLRDQDKILPEGFTFSETEQEQLYQTIVKKLANRGFSNPFQFRQPKRYGVTGWVAGNSREEIASNAKRLVEPVQAIMQELGGVYATFVVTSSDECIDIMVPGLNKSLAIRYMKEVMGIDPKKIAATDDRADQHENGRGLLEAAVGFATDHHDPNSKGQIPLSLIWNVRGVDAWLQLQQKLKFVRSEVRRSLKEALSAQGSSKESYLSLAERAGIPRDKALYRYWVVETALKLAERAGLPKAAQDLLERVALVRDFGRRGEDSNPNQFESTKAKLKTLGTKLPLKADELQDAANQYNSQNRTSLNRLEYARMVLEAEKPADWNAEDEKILGEVAAHELETVRILKEELGIIPSKDEERILLAHHWFNLLGDSEPETVSKEELYQITAIIRLSLVLDTSIREFSKTLKKLEEFFVTGVAKPEGIPDAIRDRVLKAFHQSLLADNSKWYADYLRAAYPADVLSETLEANTQFLVSAPVLDAFHNGLLMAALEKRVIENADRGEVQISPVIIEALLNNPSIKVTWNVLEAAIAAVNESNPSFSLMGINGEPGNMYLIQSKTRSEVRQTTKITVAPGKSYPIDRHHTLVLQEIAKNDQKKPYSLVGTAVWGERSEIRQSYDMVERLLKSEGHAPYEIAGEVSRIAFGFFRLVPQEIRGKIQSFIWHDLISDQIATAPASQNEKGISFVAAPELPENLSEAAEYFSHLNQTLRDNPGLHLNLILPQGSTAAKSIQTFFDLHYNGVASRLTVLSAMNGRALSREIQKQMAKHGVKYQQVTVLDSPALLNELELPVRRIENDILRSKLQLQAALATASGNLATAKPYELTGLSAERIKQLGAISRIISALNDLGFRDHMDSIEATLHAAYLARAVSHSA